MVSVHANLTKMIKLITIIKEGLENTDLIKSIFDLRGKVLHNIDLLIEDMGKKRSLFKGMGSFRKAIEQINEFHKKYDLLAKRYTARELYQVSKDTLLEIHNGLKKLEREIDGFRTLYNL